MKFNLNRLFKIEFKQFGEDAILIEWPQLISDEILNDICVFFKNIKKLNVEYVIDVNFVYCSLLVIYDNVKIDYSALRNQLNKIYNEGGNVVAVSKVTWKIPVCYHDKFGLDLDYLSQEKKCKKAEIIEAHTISNYTVFGIGFLPGFLYLGGLDKCLEFPRKLKPRLSVLKGSVGIAGNQTGIYPQDSPGGWQIIGKTPVILFNPEAKTPIEISAGDKIQFYEISLEEYEHGNYQLKKEFMND